LAERKWVLRIEYFLDEKAHQGVPKRGPDVLLED
jgi:hypothetical protein